MLASAENPAELLEMICTPGYSVPDQWQVQVQAQIQTKAQVLIKTTGLGPNEIRAAHFTPIDDVARAVHDALAQSRQPPRRCACCRRGRRPFRIYLISDWRSVIFDSLLIVDLRMLIYRRIRNRTIGE